MALQPEDDGAFMWPPPHWPFGAAAPGMPAPEVPPPQQLGPVGMPAPVDEVAPPELAMPGMPEQQPVAVPPPVTVDAVTGAGDIVPQMPEVDAISGADPATPPPPADEPVEVEGEQPESPYIDPLNPASWGKPVSATDLYAMAKRDPVAYAQHIQAMDKTAADEMKRREALVSTQNATREEQDQRDLMDSMQKANEMRDQLLATRVDANRWRDSRTTGQSIAAYISVIVGGLVQARKGGPNIGLEIIDKAIDRDIAEQEANMANQRNAIADLRASGMSDFQAKQAFRIGWYQRALDEVKTSMQDFDPAGTTARQHTQQALELEARIAQAAEMGRRAKLKEEFERRKDERETLETMAKLRESDAKYAAQMAKLRGGTGTAVPKPDDVPRDPQYFVDRYGSEEARPPGAMSEKEYATKFLPTSTKVQDLVAKRKAEQRTESALQVQGITQDDGKTLYTFASPKDAEQFRAAKAAAELANEIVGDIARGIKSHGGESNFIKSKDWQRVTSKAAFLDNELRTAGDMGSLDEGAVNLVTRMRGGVDPTSYIRDATPGLKSASESLLSKLNSKLRQQPGYNGKMLTIGDIGGDSTSLPEPVKTVDDKAIERAVKFKVLNTYTEDQKKLVQPSDRILSEKIEADNATVQADLAALGQRAAGTGDAAEKAKRTLKSIIENATDPTVRGWASDALMPAATSSTLSDSASKEGR